ncbi:hypothetical protein [Bacteriovorax sp. DB6_IX]|uniref:hypothetical protein n=1 Tax=Bacteriovorax sp. DB6_IX TaxID=1353530 RepID=UPI00038A38B8|nr:hypothetical protein [Bacteriovorax sp. DB6_IX]EQC51736.1 hypothetical protein M901_1927 [Bacteriovorax sp. DB6_IX]
MKKTQNTKTLRNIFILVVALLAGYFIYDYLEDDYIPEQKRHFYKETRLKRKKPSYVRRQLLHEEVPEAEEQEIESIAKQFKGNTPDVEKIKALIKKLDNRNKECEKFLAQNLPNEQIIDPENPIFLNADQVIGKLDFIFNDILYRDISMTAIKAFGDFYQEQREVDSDLFFNSLRSTLICRGADISLFLESAYEAMKQGQWSPEEVTRFNRTLLNLVSSSLDHDNLPDNLLFSLNVLRLVGTSSGFNEDFYGELDDVYGRISAYEDQFFDEIQDGQVIFSPGDKFQNYFEELDGISDEVRYIINRRFKDFSAN